MSTVWNEPEVTEQARSVWKNPAEAYGISTILHGLILALLSAFTLLEGSEQLSEEISSVFAHEDLSETLQPDPIRPPEFSMNAGGSQPASVIFLNASSQTQVSAPNLRDDALPAPVDVSRNASNLAAYVGALSGLGGNGRGDGQGDGDGYGFFGDPQAASSFVFVLDRSGSMNKPHLLSNGLSRFQRLKMELIGFIDRLQPSQSFFVVFFNEQTSPMPAEGLVPATPENKQKYLKWISTATAKGETDPRLSVRLAMKLDPEMIYFLSDGEVDNGYKAQMLRHDPGEWRLNAYSFGLKQAGPFMQFFSEKHNGKYTYIP